MKLQKKMLLIYVEQFKIIYGKHLISFNVDNLIHLADEVLLQNGPLDDFATCEFESYIATLKKKYGRKPSLYLQQAYKRVKNDSTRNE